MDQYFRRLWLEREPDAISVFLQEFDLASHDSVLADLDRHQSPVFSFQEELSRLAQAIGQKLAEAAPAGQRGDALDLGLAVAGLMAYYSLLLAWENTSSHDEIAAASVELSHLLAELAGPSPLPLVEAVLACVRSLPPQLGAENARFCNCPIRLGVQASQAEAALAVAQLTLETDPEGPLTDSRCRSIHRVIHRTLSQDSLNDLTFYRAMGRVGRLLEDFTAAVCPTEDPGDGRRARVALTDDLATAIPELRSTADQLRLTGDVFGAELEAACQVLDQIQLGVHKPVLVVGQGQGIFIYRCEGLSPSDNSGARVDNVVLRTSGLGDIPMTKASRLSTDAFDNLTEVFQRSTVDLARHPVSLPHGYEVRLVPAWQLARLEAEYGTRLDLDLVVEECAYHRIELTLQLSRQSGHLVRLEIPTSGWRTPKSGDRGPSTGSTSGMAEWPEATEKVAWWTCHDLATWVGRRDDGAGREKVILVRKEDNKVVLEADTLNDFVQTFTASLLSVGDGVEHHRLVVPPVDLPQLILGVEHAVRLEADGTWRTVNTQAELDDLFGLGALDTRPRSQMSSLEDWLRTRPVMGTNLLEGHAAAGDTLLAEPELIVMISLASPNWVHTERIELVELTIKLCAALEHTLGKPSYVPNEVGADSLPTIESLFLRRARLLNVLKLLDGDHIIKPPAYRRVLKLLLQAIGGIELRGRVESDIERIDALISESQESSRHQDSLRLDRFALQLTLIALFIAFYQLVEGILPNDEAVWARLAEAVVAVAITGVFLWGRRWYQRRSGR